MVGVSSRKLSDLHPYVAVLAASFIQECAKAGFDVIVTSTFRDHAAQDALYAQGRTVPGPRVTAARGGESFHNYRVAFDFVPVVNGKCEWADTSVFARCGAIAEGLGLEWAGRWTSFRELAHCQFTGGLTLVEFKAGKNLAVAA